LVHTPPRTEKNNSMSQNNFSEKLKLVLKVLVVSRTGLAAALNVDKSLTGRWVAGSVKPSEHNLAKITRYVAERVPGFTLLDWDKDLDDLREILGVSGSSRSIDGPTDVESWIPPSILNDALHNGQRRGHAYEGIWKSTRASNDLPGRFIHDICMIQMQENGILGFRVGVEGVRYVGHSLLLQHQFFSIATDTEYGTMMFSIYNGVSRQRPEVIDGVNLTTLRDAGGSPIASASVMHRFADLSGNHEDDLALFEKSIAELNPLAEEGSVPKNLQDHLTRNVSDGAPGILRLLYGQSMARGVLIDEH